MEILTEDFVQGTLGKTLPWIPPPLLNWNFSEDWCVETKYCIPPSRYRLVVPGFYSHFWQTSLFVYLQEDGDSVGFATLPEQVHRKAIKRGFDFTLMVVGMYLWSESCYFFGDSYIKISSQQSTQGEI